MEVTKLLDYCSEPGFNDLDYYPVITLIKTSSRTGETQGHAVVLDKYDRYGDGLVLTTIDSASETGETLIDCPITIKNGRERLTIGGEMDQLCLGSENCYAFYFN